jgi:hypothetical protein
MGNLPTFAGRRTAIAIFGRQHIVQEGAGQAVSESEGVALLQVSIATARGCEGLARVVIEG